MSAWILVFFAFNWMGDRPPIHVSNVQLLGTYATEQSCKNAIDAIALEQIHKDKAADVDQYECKQVPPMKSLQ